MKKFITITSILAAGTLCASAEINLGDNLITQTASSGSGATFLTALDVSAIFSNSLIAGTSTITEENIISNATVGTIYVCNGNGSGTQYGIGSSYAKFSDGTLKIGNLTNSNGIVTFVMNTLSESALLEISNDLKLTFEVSGLSATTNPQSLSVTVLYGTDSDWTVIGNEYATIENGTHTINLTYNGNYSTSGNFLVFLGTGTTPTGSSGTWADMSTSGSTAAVSISNLIFAIPEPSMFGLLAGTLALGLAGTRRRRR